MRGSNVGATPLYSPTPTQIVGEGMPIPIGRDLSACRPYVGSGSVSCLSHPNRTVVHGPVPCRSPSSWCLTISIRQLPCPTHDLGGSPRGRALRRLSEHGRPVLCRFVPSRARFCTVSPRRSDATAFPEALPPHPTRSPGGRPDATYSAPDLVSIPLTISPILLISMT